MMPATWHFPVEWRETVMVKGRPWVYRRGLHWSFFYPADATIRPGW